MFLFWGVSFLLILPWAIILLIPLAIIPASICYVIHSLLLNPRYENSSPEGSILLTQIESQKLTPAAEQAS